RAQDATAGEPTNRLKLSGTLVQEGVPDGTSTDVKVGNRYYASEALVKQWQPYLVTTFRDPADETLGATLEPVADLLRAQLELPPDRGLMVAAVTGDGPAARAGLEQNDILLTLADKPLAKADDLSEHLKAAGKSPLTLKLLRKGKPVVLSVRPVFQVTL